MEIDFWPWVLIFAALYLLCGVIVYVVLEARNAGKWEPADCFTPWEMCFIVLAWPAIAVYALQIYLKKWGIR